MRASWSSRGLVAACVCVSISALAAATVVIPNLGRFKNPSGEAATFNTAGDINRKNAFFQDLGTNGRTCETCHQANQGFSITPESVQALYDRTHGADPLFRMVDGANCPDADPHNRDSYSLLLSRGLIRVAITLPLNAQFTVLAAHDPYGCAIRYDPVTNQQIISVYRRPLPSSNLRFLSAVMFDGRETVAPLTDAASFDANLRADLTHQAASAVQGHAQGVMPTPAQLAEIVNFELGLTTAQLRSNDAGNLQSARGNGGPVALALQPYHPGTNDALGHDPSGLPFAPSAMSLYSGWATSNDANQRDIAAGEVVFNTAVATITDVAGLNDNPALNSPPVILGTCTTCHDTPNVGNHSLPLPLDIAVSRQSTMELNPDISSALQQLTPPDLPVYEISGCPDLKHPGHTTVFYTSDPGKALLTGQCADVGRGKGPILRGLAARAPYFHNGAAADLNQLVNFYNLRFRMNLTDKQKHDLIAFLNSL